MFYFLSFPVHVFFDDAYELCDGDDEEMVVNRFVKQLVQIMDTAARSVLPTLVTRLVSFHVI